MERLYDRIGIGYGEYRRADPRVARFILDALGEAETVLNVRAGAGSYEPEDRRVVAVELSLAMIRQRREGSAPVVQASAMELPFRDGSFDAGLAILTVHHWADRAKGLRELARVARRCVLVTFDPEASGFWLTEDYFPAIREDDYHVLPSMDELREALGRIEVRTLMVPHDCIDGFLGAYWRRPEAYLDVGVRAAISAFSKIDGEAGVDRLRRDLEDGTWERRYGHLREMGEIDLGYRIVVAEGGLQRLPAP
jgi:SAM-dependent methyltransferase